MNTTKPVMNTNTNNMTDAYTDTSRTNMRSSGRPSSETGRHNLRKFPGYYFESNKKPFKYLFYFFLNVLAIAYFYMAWKHWNETKSELKICEGFGNLIAAYVIVYMIVLYFFIKFLLGKWWERNFGEKIEELNKQLSKRHHFRVCIWFVVLVLIIVYICVDTMGNFSRLIALAALSLLLILGFVFSSNPARINWNIVLAGLVLQFTMGLLSIRWNTGRRVFKCVSDKIATFLSYGLDGAAFAYGDNLVRGPGSVFAFAALPVIYYFSMMVEIMVYYGIIQSFVLSLGRCLQCITETTVCESVICIANVFLGMTEALFLIKPYIPLLTPSEMHIVLASGFGSVSGYILAIYIAFGANPAHLVTASIMSAPASICYAKLMMPETQESLTTSKNMNALTIKSDDKSVLAAAIRGAANAVMLVLNIIAVLVAFVAFLTLINATLTYFGDMVGVQNLKLELIFGKVFMPLAFIMGVPWEECQHVGALIGIKTMVNEFVAYQRLGEMKRLGMLSPRSELIATYSLCGFANPCSVGIMVGAITSMAPQQRDNVSKVAFRAFFTGCGVCFMTASIAGLLMPEGSFDISV